MTETQSQSLHARRDIGKTILNPIILDMGLSSNQVGKIARPKADSRGEHRKGRGYESQSMISHDHASKRPIDGFVG